jgi:hypothetical protein
VNEIAAVQQLIDKRMPVVEWRSRRPLCVETETQRAVRRKNPRAVSCGRAARIQSRGSEARTPQISAGLSSARCGRIQLALHARKISARDNFYEKFPQSEDAWGAYYLEISAVSTCVGCVLSRNFRSQHMRGVRTF